MGEGRPVVPGGGARARRVGYGMAHASVGVMDAGGQDALLVAHGPAGAAQAGLGAPVAVAGIDRRGAGMSGGYDAGHPRQRVVVVGDLSDALARGAEKSVQSAGTVTEAFAPLNRVSSYPYISA